MFDVKKFGIVYLMVGLVAVVFVLTRLFPHVTLQDLTTGRFNASESAALTNPSAVSVTIDFGDSKKTYTGISAANAYEALVAAAKQDKLEVAIKQYDFGVLVEKIGAFANTTDQAWVYYVNGVSGDAAADKKELKAGDSVEWKYVRPQ